VDDKALLRQAFLEACSVKDDDVPASEKAGLTVSKKTDRKILRMIYRKSRRKRALHAVSVVGRNAAALLIAMGIFFFPRIETDAEQSQYTPVWMEVTSKEVVFSTSPSPVDMRSSIGEELYQISVVPEEFKDSEPYCVDSDVDMRTIWDNGEDSLVLTQCLPGVSSGYDNEHCLEMGWKTVGNRKVYIIVYSDSSVAALWVEGERGSDYVMSIFYHGKDATSEMVEKMVSSLCVTRR